MQLNNRIRVGIGLLEQAGGQKQIPIEKGYAMFPTGLLGRYSPGPQASPRHLRKPLWPSIAVLPASRRVAHRYQRSPASRPCGDCCMSDKFPNVQYPLSWFR